MKSRRSGKLRKRYGRAFPLIPLALAKLGAAEKVALLIEPLVRWGGGGWRYVTGGKKKGRKS